MKIKPKQLMGRDTTYGRVSFRGGVVTPKHKRNRRSKHAKNELRRDLRGD